VTRDNNFTQGPNGFKDFTNLIPNEEPQVDDPDLKLSLQKFYDNKADNRKHLIKLEHANKINLTSYDHNYQTLQESPQLNNKNGTDPSNPSEQH